MSKIFNISEAATIALHSMGLIAQSDKADQCPGDCRYHRFFQKPYFKDLTATGKKQLPGIYPRAQRAVFWSAKKPKMFLLDIYTM
jgi:hypothetical protein